MYNTYVYPMTVEHLIVRRYITDRWKKHFEDVLVLNKKQSSTGRDGFDKVSPSIYGYIINIEYTKRD